MADTYETWLAQVQEALRSINMDVDDWQSIWPFDFQVEHNSGTTPTGRYDPIPSSNTRLRHYRRKSLMA